MPQDLSASPYRDASLDVEARLDDLIGRMTPREKLNQIGCVWSTQLVTDGEFSEERAKLLLREGIGQVTRIGATTGLRPRESAAFMNRIQHFLLEETRLGIPALVHEESTAGFTARDADQFPQAIGLASTWEPSLLQRAGETICQQMMAVGARLTLAPVLDIARDPRWGRLEETYGEDPYLVSRLGVAYVRGIQGKDLSRGVAATAKHFLGYGVSEGGHNHKPAHIGARELREVYARPFLSVIQEAGLASVMNAYNELDGLPCGGAKEILDDLLRGELGFDGVVVADYFTTLLLIASHRVADNKADAGQMAIEAGLDVELPSLDCFGELESRLEDGSLAIEVVDRSVRRHLRLKFQLGLFERCTVSEPAAATVYQTSGTRALARELAQKSLVLLRNQEHLLPLSKEIRSVAVLGPCADDVRLLQGDYHYPAHAEITYAQQEHDMGDILPRSAASSLMAGPYYPPSVTPLMGVRRAVSSQTLVRYAKGCAINDDDASGFADAVAAARDAEVALVFVGGKSGLMPDCTSGEFRDAASLDLTGLQRRLIDQVVATGTPTVVILINGRVFAMPELSEQVPALLEAWIPGEEGGAAIADVLFGLVNPAGRLPVSLPRSVGQIPIHSGIKWSPEKGALDLFPAAYSDLAASPLYAFGHGLSYTHFDYSNLQITPEDPAAGVKIEITLDVTNAGDRSGDEVVQLYIQDLVASVTRPVHLLVGFVRAPFEPGQTRTIRFTLHPSQLAFYDRQMKFVVEPGGFDVRVGAASDDIRLHGHFDVSGEVREYSTRAIQPTRVEIE